VKTEIAASRTLQRYYPRVVIGIAFLTVAVAFGTRNALLVFWSQLSKSFVGERHGKTGKEIYRLS
jgi:hypothetical protein